MGYFFALFSPFLDSINNYIDKFLLSKYEVSTTILAIYSGLFAFVTGTLVFLFMGFHSIDIQTAGIIIISGFLSVFILLTYFQALTHDEASRVASLFQLIPVFVIILSFLFLQERFLPKQYIGCLFIIIGGFLFSVRRKKDSIIHINKAFWWMVISSLLFAIVSILFKIGAKEVGFWQAIPYEGLGNFFAALAIVFYGKNRKRLQKETKQMPKKVFFYLSVSEFIYRVSRYAFYYALFLLPASLVSVFQGFQPLFLLIEGITLSLWLPKIIKELVSAKTIGIKLTATLGIFIGLYLIFL